MSDKFQQSYYKIFAEMKKQIKIVQRDITKDFELAPIGGVKTIFVISIVKRCTFYFI